MKPLRITARGYRSYGTLDYTFVDGATAVTGENGSGKSSLIGAVDFALFGTRGRSLEPYVREGSDEMTVELTFSHGSETYRVRRGWKSGRSTLDLERLEEHMAHVPGVRDYEDDEVPAVAWMPLTQGSAADTQALVDRIVGMTRSTFQCSGYLPQRTSDSFTGAQPRDRKRILGEALNLASWQHDCERITADKRTAQADRDGKAARLEAVAEQARQAESLAAEKVALDDAIAAATAAEQTARAEAEQHAARARDLEQADTAWTTRKAAVDVAAERERSHLAKLERTDAAKAQRAEALASLDTLGLPGDVEALEQQERTLTDAHETYRLAAHTRAEAERNRDNLAAQAQTAAGEAQAFRAKAEQTLDLIGGSQHCDTCGQTLGEEAARVAAATYIAKAERHDADAAAIVAMRQAVVVPDLPAEAPDGDTIDALRQSIQRARQSEKARAEVATFVAVYDATIGETDNDGYRDQARRLAFDHEEARRVLAEISQPEPGAAVKAAERALHLQAEAAAHADRARASSERHAAVRALLEQAVAAKEEHDRLAQEIAGLDAELVILDGLERAFGRDGVPAWIIESRALPHIETEANRILARLGGAITRVELRTERETKSGKVNEALDVICFTDDGERALETFSGSEQTRAEIALALGLAAVLAASRDADLRFLALDEPEGLDDAGSAALAGLLQEIAGDRVVMLVSHSPALRDQFDQAITVTRGPSGSQVTA